MAGVWDGRKQVMLIIKITVYSNLLSLSFNTLFFLNLTAKLLIEQCECPITKFCYMYWTPVIG